MQMVVIGAGAAGFFAAIRCAELSAISGNGVQVQLLEATRRVLTKVRVSGGGRCNVTHHCFDPTELVRCYPRGGRELRGPFSRFQPRDTVAWYSTRGVELKVEDDGRMFPTTDSSETIARCLESAASAAGVGLRLGALVRGIEQRPQGGFAVRLREGEVLAADAVLLATGSAAFGYDLARQLGHTIEPLVPSLFTFNVEDARLSDLAGVSFPNVRLKLAFAEREERLQYAGPLLITHWGLSGPAVLKLSAFGALALHASGYQADLEIAFLPDQTVETVLAQLRAYKDLHPKRSMMANSPLELPRRFWQRLVSLYAADAPNAPNNLVWAEATKAMLTAMAKELTQGRYRITGKGVFKEEFVTAGGVRLKEVNFKTMESRLVPNLFFAGELLDIDGITGGFNFQNAWTTGWIAGSAMAALEART